MIFVVMNDLPDVIVVSTIKVCQELCNKLMLLMEKSLPSIDEMMQRKILSIFAHNLVVYKEATHELSKQCLRRLAQIKNTSLLALLYLNRAKVDDDIRFSAAFHQKVQSKKCSFIEEALLTSGGVGKADLSAMRCEENIQQQSTTTTT